MGDPNAAVKRRHDNIPQDALVWREHNRRTFGGVPIRCSASGQAAEPGSGR